MTPPPTTAQLRAAAWVKSTYSAPNNECVEYAHVGGWAAVRDSKSPGHAPVVLPQETFVAFLRHLKTR
ncbi:MULTISPECIES: DUF397 domain-containing protein [Streptomyces]|uniref:DUF397 domain-containing protein n=1 Tax=Streptomyces TaxID=1883 RepID=UPI0004CACB98|nr:MULTISPECIES: DUF397 domain-containing protein [Streptomyces]